MSEIDAKEIRDALSRQEQAIAALHEPIHNINKSLESLAATEQRMGDFLAAQKSLGERVEALEQIVTEIRAEDRVTENRLKFGERLFWWLAAAAAAIVASLSTKWFGG